MNRRIQEANFDVGPALSISSTFLLRQKISWSSINHELIKPSSADLSVDPSLTCRSPRKTIEFPRTDNQGLGGLGAGGLLLEFSLKKCYHNPSVCSADRAMHLVCVFDHHWDFPCIHPFKALIRLKQCALETYALCVQCLILSCRFC